MAVPVVRVSCRVVRRSTCFINRLDSLADIDLFWNSTMIAWPNGLVFLHVWFRCLYQVLFERILLLKLTKIFTKLFQHSQKYIDKASPSGGEDCGFKSRGDHNFFASTATSIRCICTSATRSAFLFYFSGTFSQVKIISAHTQELQEYHTCNKFLIFFFHRWFTAKNFFFF